MYGIDTETRHFPDVLAVDPKDCGCTECLIGEYVPLVKWFASALPGDVIALIEDEVGNNTHYGLAGLLESYSYSVQETKDFLREFERYQHSDEAVRHSYTEWEIS